MILSSNCEFLPNIERFIVLAELLKDGGVGLRFR